MIVVQMMDAKYVSRIEALWFLVLRYVRWLECFKSLGTEELRVLLRNGRR